MGVNWRKGKRFTEVAEAMAAVGAPPFRNRPEFKRAPNASGHPWQPPARAIVSAAAAEPAMTPAQISCTRHANVMHFFVKLNSGKSQLSKQQLFCVLILWQAESALWHAVPRPFPPAASQPLAARRMFLLSWVPYCSRSELAGLPGAAARLRRPP